MIVVKKNSEIKNNPIKRKNDVLLNKIAKRVDAKRLREEKSRILMTGSRRYEV